MLALQSSIPRSRLEVFGRCDDGDVEHRLPLRYPTQDTREVDKPNAIIRRTECSRNVYTYLSGQLVV